MSYYLDQLVKQGKKLNLEQIRARKDKKILAKPKKVQV